MMSGYGIQSRRDNLRSYRVRLRNEIARQAQLIRWRSGDAIDGQRRLENLQLQLRGTEREWSELEAMLGRPYPVKPVKLNVPARRSGTTIRSPAPYLTRAMSSR
jgi:hypothetical protein